MLDDDARVQAEPPVTIDRLPEEILAAVVLHLWRDDYHMLTLRLVSKQFELVCGTPAVEAARLASRLRQVADGVVLGQGRLDDWSIGHVWGALRVADAFLSGGRDGGLSERMELLCNSPGGAPSLKHLVARCADASRSPPPRARTAEEIFLETEANRLQPMQPSGPTPRALSGERAAESAAAALNLKSEARDVLRREAKAQAQRQLAATCRRNWKQLPPAQRRQWEQRAAAETEASMRRGAAMHTAVSLATNLARRMQDCDCHSLP